MSISLTLKPEQVRIEWTRREMLGRASIFRFHRDAPVTRRTKNVGPSTIKHHKEAGSMHTHRLTVTVFSLGAALAFGAPVMSADLPQSGTIKIHSNIKANSQAVQVGEKHFMASGNGFGMTYNDAGSGPLHMGAWFCTFTADDVNGSFNDGGACAFGDAGGADKIFVGWSGKGTDNAGEQGTGTITGGSGKYAGIAGRVEYQCKPVEPLLPTLACTQQFEYQLTSTSAAK